MKASVVGSLIVACAVAFSLTAIAQEGQKPGENRPPKSTR